MLFQYFIILATLTVAFGSPFDWTKVVEGQQERPYALLQLIVGPHSKYVSRFENDNTVMGGEWISKDRNFVSDQPMYTDIIWQENNATDAAPFWWLTYDKGVKQEDLKDEHIKYNMSCKAQLLEGHNASTSYVLGLEIVSAYLTPIPWDWWDSIVNRANIICDSGECVASDGCKGLDMPKWDQEFLDKQEEKIEKERQELGIP